MVQSLNKKVDLTINATSYLGMANYGKVLVGDEAFEYYNDKNVNDYIHLSTDGTWGNHMQFTSNATSELGKINGPRCCKRDAMIAFKNGVEYVNSHYDVILEYEHMKCEYSDQNAQCIKERCPYYMVDMKTYQVRQERSDIKQCKTPM